MTTAMEGHVLVGQVVNSWLDNAGPVKVAEFARDDVFSGINQYRIAANLRERTVGEGRSDRAVSRCQTWALWSNRNRDNYISTHTV